MTTRGARCLATPIREATRRRMRQPRVQPICPVGTLDLFVDEDIEYARRLIRAGVPTELKVYPGAYHGFEDLAPDAAISRAFVLDYFNALQRALKQGECAAGNSPSD
jgi:acetyl esterase/lipase